MREMKYDRKLWSGNIKGRDHLENLDVNGWIKSKWIL
jgi:hypothetical protein